MVPKKQRVFWKWPDNKKKHLCIIGLLRLSLTVSTSRQLRNIAILPLIQSIAYIQSCLKGKKKDACLAKRHRHSILFQLAVLRSCQSVVYLLHVHKVHPCGVNQFEAHKVPAPLRRLLDCVGWCPCRGSNESWMYRQRGGGAVQPHLNPP